MIKLKAILENGVVRKIKPPMPKTKNWSVRKAKRKTVISEELVKKLKVKGQHFEIVADDGDTVLYDVFCVKASGAGQASND